MTKTSILRYLSVILLLIVTTGCEPDDAQSGGSQPPDNASTENMAENNTASAMPASQSTARQPGDPLPTIRSASDPQDGYQEIQWEDLMPDDFRPQTILAKYEKELEQLAELDDSDPKAMELYGKIQAEMDNAPVNPALNGKKIKLPGFIAPLENSEDKVTEFLLVPYFGACIHVPPPPINQTVMVKTRVEDGIPSAKSFLPYWIKGTITTDGEDTEIGSAGYRIEQAATEEFSE